jgi:hypothetical protein
LFGEQVLARLLSLPALRTSGSELLALLCANQKFLVRLSEHHQDLLPTVLRACNTPAVNNPNQP